MAPTVESVKVSHGIAGQLAAYVKVNYGGDTSEVSFVGSSFGGPVVMITATLGQQFVTTPERFGSFGSDPEGWVSRFYTTDGEDA